MLLIYFFDLVVPIVKNNHLKSNQDRVSQIKTNHSTILFCFVWSHSNESFFNSMTSNDKIKLQSKTTETRMNLIQQKIGTSKLKSRKNLAVDKRRS